MYLNGEEPWACSDCDCTKRLESRIEKWGDLFLDKLKKTNSNSSAQFCGIAIPLWQPDMISWPTSCRFFTDEGFRLLKFNLLMFGFDRVQPFLQKPKKLFFPERFGEIIIHIVLQTFFTVPLHCMCC